MDDFGEGLLAWQNLVNGAEILWFWLSPLAFAAVGFAIGRAGR